MMHKPALSEFFFNPSLVSYFPILWIVLLGVFGQESFSDHSQNMTVAARATAESKTFGHLS
jgi:hypothetical protein